MKKNIYEMCLDLNARLVCESRDAILKFDVARGTDIDRLHLLYITELAYCKTELDFAYTYNEYLRKFLRLC